MKHIFLLAIVLGLAACGSRVGGAPVPAPTAGADLTSLGHFFIWLGGAAVVIGAAARLFLGAALGTIAAEAGVVAVASGIAFTWLGEHLVLALVATLVAWGVWRHRSVARWLRGWMDHAAAEAPAQRVPAIKPLV